MIKHFLAMSELPQSTVVDLLDKAQHFLNNEIRFNRVNVRLHGQVVANLFFEPSTRTLNSFEIAAHRLGAIVITPPLENSSLIKGESAVDTILSLEAMGAKAVIVRHHDDNFANYAANFLKTDTLLINAGSGKSQHPTQALLDLLTIQQHKPNAWQNLRIAIIGDIQHSRVARSLVEGLAIMEVPDIRLIAPPAFIPSDISAPGLQRYHNLREGIEDADVIVCLRLQYERHADTNSEELDNLKKTFSLTEEMIQHAKKDVIVMHPGPINREMEISSSIADGSRSVILEQVKNGVAVRMAVLDSLLSESGIK